MKGFRTLARIGVVLCLVVVVMGGWVRLTDAGLGCPDWPGCYGRLVAPDMTHAEAAGEAFPERPLDTGKAWREMIHRYAAGVLGLVMFALAILALLNRRDPEQPRGIPLFLAVLIVFQALLGMWTVTLLLKPLVVMGHLLGGMATLALLAWLALPSRRTQPDGGAALRRVAGIALAVAVVQIALGGWVSANYAALACPDLPTCQTRWWPAMDFASGFKAWHGLGIDYQGGILHNSARVAIHVTHRIGAVVALFVIGLGAIWAWRRAPAVPGRTAALLVGGAVLAQFAVGIAMVGLSLPLPLAVAHNGFAALLLLSLINLTKVAWRAD